MATEQDGFLAMIKAKIAALQTLAESYRAALSVGALGQLSDLDLPASTPTIDGSAQQNGAAPVDLPVGVFRDKSIPDAIKLFLAAQRRKQTGKEIATGLLAGGLVSTSKRFEATVHGVLHRLKVAGVVLRFKEGWDLAESYPEHLRNRIANGTSSTSKPKPKKKAKRRRTKKSEAQPEDGLETRIESFLNSHQMGVFVPAEISKAVGGDVRIVRLSLARMVKKKKARKHPDADDSYTAYRKNMDALRAV